MLQNRIDSLKVSLYRALLAKSATQLTDNEVDLLYILSKDAAIQKILEDAIGKGK